MTHPRDQWFRIYVYLPWTQKIEVRDGKPVALTDDKGEPIMDPPTWRPVPILHVHHPDAYHPDPKVAIRHHRKMRKRALAPAACGLEHDPRLRFVEEHDPAERCPDCVRETEAAREKHEKIEAERIQAQNDRLLALEKAAEADKVDP